MKFRWIDTVALAILLLCSTTVFAQQTGPIDIDPIWLTAPDTVRGQMAPSRVPTIPVEDEGENPLIGDRPDFTESSCTVGRGVLQIESGYTYVYDRTADAQVDGHVLPEALLRIGLTDYLELRIGWEGYVFSREKDLGTGAVDHTDGATDLDLGFKLEFNEQEGWIPESALIVSCTAPTGHPLITSNQVDTVVNYCYGWEFSEGFSLGCSTGNLWTADGAGDQFTVTFQSAVLGMALSEKSGTFFEWYVLCPGGSDDNRAQHYVDTGLTYLVTPNFQIDWHIGMGISDAADDFYTGAGLVIRFR